MAGRRPSWKTGVNTDPELGLYFSPEQVERQRQYRKDRCIPPTDEQAVERVLNVFEHATDDEIQAGIEWYLSAHDMCDTLFEEYPANICSSYHAAGVVAVLSPRLSWNDNIRRARQFIETGETGGVQNWVELAKQIKAGADPFSVVFDPSRQNWKVRSFLMNICFPEWTMERRVELPEQVANESWYVTVDRHAWAMLYDDRTIGDVLLRPTKKLYEWGRDVFVAAADEIDDIMPHELQAVTWLVWRTRRSLDTTHQQTVLF